MTNREGRVWGKTIGFARLLHQTLDSLGNISCPEVQMPRVTSLSGPGVKGSEKVTRFFLTSSAKKRALLLPIGF